MAQVAKSQISGKIKRVAGKAWQSSRDKAPTVKGARLPGGITGGVARFIDYRYGETEKEKAPFLSLTFVVDKPDDWAGVKHHQRFTFAATKFKTVEQVCDDLSSDLQLMGIDSSAIDFDDLDSTLDPLLDEAKAEERAVRYNTRSGKTGDGNDWHKFDLQGLADGYVPDEASPEQEPAPEASGESEPPAAEGTETASGDDYVPEPGDVFYYRPNAKAKKEEHTVESADAAARTVTIKRNRDGKLIENVPFDKLEGEE